MDEVKRMKYGDALRGNAGYAKMTYMHNRKLKTVDLFMVKELEIKMSLEKTDGKTMGVLTTQNRVVGASYSGSMTIYDCTPHFTNMAYEYRATGVIQPFSIIVENYDPASTITNEAYGGSPRRVMATGCLLDELTLAKLSLDDEAEAEVDFTCEDVLPLSDFAEEPATYF